MLTDFIDTIRQYRWMISREEKRKRAAMSKRVLAEVTDALKPGDVVFDCGANVGLVTGALAETGAKVHAFEPDPVAFGVLEEKFAGQANVTLYNAAVGIRDGEIGLRRDHHFDKNPVARTTRSTTVEGGRRMAGEDDVIMVPLLDLRRLLREVLTTADEIAFLKLDVEGAEIDILEAMEAENLFEPIRLTVAETHEKKFSQLRPRFRRLRKRFAAAYPASKVNLDWN